MKLLFAIVIISLIGLSILFNWYAWWEPYKIYRKLQPPSDNFSKFVHQFRVQTFFGSRFNIIESQPHELRAHIALVLRRTRCFFWLGALNFIVLLVISFA
jgi:hypothetical protein